MREKKNPDFINKKTHVFLALIPLKIVKLIYKPFLPLIKFFSKLNPDLENDLDAIDHELNSIDYISSGFFSYLLIGSILGYLIYLLAISKGRELNIAILSGFGIAFIVFFLFNYLLTKNPKSELREKAIDADRYLIYALKEMVIYSRAGLSLFELIVAVSNSGYGEVSVQFKRVAREVNTGKPFSVALEDVVKRTKSSYFKKVIWQISNTLKTGSDISQMLQPIIEELDYHQKSLIENYSRELNLWSLVYMIFSAAIPTIGSTMLVVLSVFADFGVNEGFFIMFALVCIIVQIVLIYLVKSRRPNVIF